mmetsp:Transcript_15863/g.32071  ORF Transcript_15863/g.32071 Transcript_15863/m.32071 type:complete len:201 (+) Transcript_15863:338-940(+)
MYAMSWSVVCSHAHAPLPSRACSCALRAMTTLCAPPPSGVSATVALAERIHPPSVVTASCVLHSTVLPFLPPRLSARPPPPRPPPPPPSSTSARSRLTVAPCRHSSCSSAGCSSASTAPAASALPPAASATTPRTARGTPRDTSSSGRRVPQGSRARTRSSPSSGLPSTKLRRTTRSSMSAPIARRRGASTSSVWAAGGA